MGRGTIHPGVNGGGVLPLDFECGAGSKAPQSQALGMKQRVEQAAFSFDAVGQLPPDGQRCRLIALPVGEHPLKGPTGDMLRRLSKSLRSSPVSSRNVSPTRGSSSVWSRAQISCHIALRARLARLILKRAPVSCSTSGRGAFVMRSINPMQESNSSCAASNLASRFVDGLPNGSGGHSVGVSEVRCICCSGGAQEL